MYLDTVKDIKSLINNLPRSKTNDKLNNSLQIALDIVENYATEIAVEERNIKLQTVKDVLSQSLEQHTNRSILFEVTNESDVIVFNIDDTYSFKLNVTTDIKQLENFIEFTLNALGVEIVEIAIIEPIPTWGTSTDIYYADPKTTTLTNTPIENNVIIEEPVTPPPEIEYIDVWRDVELTKKKNVEHLNKVRDDMNKISDTARKAKLKERTDEIAHAITDTHMIISLIRNGVSTVFDKIKEPKINLTEVIKMVTDEIGNSSNLRWVRLMVKIEEINRRNRLMTIPTIIIDSDIKNGQIAAIDKKDMAYITVCNLVFIANHNTLRPYSIFELIIYMLDYCDKTSSLSIAETPEEIANLMSAVYEIFVSNNLNKDFVYDVTDDITSLGTFDTWHKKNDIVMSYLNNPRFTKDIQNDDVRKVFDIYSKRDTLMSTQTLNYNDTRLLSDLLIKINTYNDEGVILNHIEENDTYIIVARNIGRYTHLCFVLDDLGVMSYLKESDSKAFQKSYTPQHASDLLKWFSVLIRW